MNQITLSLPEASYQRLLAVAQACRKSPEEWLTEQVTEKLAHSPTTAAEARQIAAAFLKKRVGLLLVPKRATLKAKQGIWYVSVIPNVQMKKPPSVGQVEVDVQSGNVLTPVAETTAMLRVAEALLGMEEIPMEKQARLRVLRALSSQSKLTEAQHRELNQLVIEAEYQTQANLRRWAELVRVPPAEQPEFRRLIDEAERAEAQVYGEG